MDDSEPPRDPPPLLKPEEISSLCMHGWLRYQLREQLREQIDQLNRTASKFFASVPADKTAALDQKSSEEEGWFDVPSEKQYVTFRRELSNQALLEQEARAVWIEVSQLLHRVLCDLSRAGGLPLESWDAVLAGSQSFPPRNADLRDTTSMMRLFEYLPNSGTAAQHTDLGLLTLCVGTDLGLEVLDPWQRPPEWVDGSKCTILVGETLRGLSNGNIAAGVHRVVGNPRGRQSFVFALRPNLGAVVDARHFGMEEGHVNLRDLFTTIKGSKYNVNARPEVRERQKERRREHNVASQGTS